MMIEIEKKFDFLERYFSNGIELICDEDGYLFERRNKAKIWIDDKNFIEVKKVEKRLKIECKKKDFLISLEILKRFKIYCENLDVWLNNSKIEMIKLDKEMIEKLVEESKDINIIEVEIEDVIEQEMMVWIERPEFEDEYLRMLNEESAK